MITGISNYIIPGLATAIISLLLVLTKGFHGKHTCDPTDGIQKFHECHTPRIGGIAIFCGLIIACFLSTTPETKLLKLMLIASLPAFAAGIIEDLTKKAGVNRRLFATILSGTMAWWLTGYTLNHIDIQGIDILLSYLPISLAFTVFAVAGISNAANIIDGFNGLSSGTIMICFSALGIIAWQVGDLDLMHTCLLLTIVTGGFFIINFPLGKIFLGDSGAYLLGFMLAWVAVMLPMRNPTVSAWAPFLICSYPFIETTYSMGRRIIKQSSTSQPDIDHLHSLIKINVINRQFPNIPKHIRNSMVSPFCWIIVIISASISVAYYKQTTLLIAASICIFILYVIVYKILTKLNPLKEPVLKEQKICPLIAKDTTEPEYLYKKNQVIEESLIAEIHNN